MSTTESWGESEDLYVKQSDRLVISSSPRHPLVAIRSMAADMDVLVAPGPHSWDKDETVHSNWCNDLTRIVMARWSRAAPSHLLGGCGKCGSESERGTP